MISKERADHLDQVLTGLAMYEAYIKRDTEALKGMSDNTDPRDAIASLLSAMEVVNGIFAAQLGFDAERVTASIRRKIIVELTQNTVA